MRNCDAICPGDRFKVRAGTAWGICPPTRWDTIGKIAACKTKKGAYEKKFSYYVYAISGPVSGNGICG